MRTFLLKNEDRNYLKLPSTGAHASYVAGHPDGYIERRSSFNFHEYQGGIPGFGIIRVFGEEIFSPSAGYNMHPHHDFIIMAVVLDGQLTHINTLNEPDSLGKDEFYIFSTGSGGKHSELNIKNRNLHGIYIWILPDTLLSPPSYHKGFFDRNKQHNQITTLIGEKGILPTTQDFKLSRLTIDAGKAINYKMKSPNHGIYVFLVAGEIIIDGLTLKKGDSIALVKLDNIKIEVKENETDILFAETIM